MDKPESLITKALRNKWNKKQAATRQNYSGTSTCSTDFYYNVEEEYKVFLTLTKKQPPRKIPYKPKNLGQSVAV